jgi:hypothetical protein
MHQPHAKELGDKTGSAGAQKEDFSGAPHGVNKVSQFLVIILLVNGNEIPDCIRYFQGMFW